MLTDIPAEEYQAIAYEAKTRYLHYIFVYADQRLLLPVKAKETPMGICESG